MTFAMPRLSASEHFPMTRAKMLHSPEFRRLMRAAIRLSDLFKALASLSECGGAPWLAALAAWGKARQQGAREEAAANQAAAGALDAAEDAPGLARADFYATFAALCEARAAAPEADPAHPDAEGAHERPFPADPGAMLECDQAVLMAEAKTATCDVLDALDWLAGGTDDRSLRALRDLGLERQAEARRELTADLEPVAALYGTFAALAQAMASAMGAEDEDEGE